MAVLPSRQRVKAWAADSHFGVPGDTVFGYKAPLCVYTVTVQPLCGHCVPKVGPQTAQGAQKVSKRIPKSSLLGGQSVTFEDQISESGTL